MSLKHNEPKKKLSVKLFLGCCLSSEIKMHLSQSPQWKQATIAPQKGSRDLTLTHFQGKDYLGFYLPDSQLSLPELIETEQHIKQHLLSYCPDFEADRSMIYIFPQVFVA